MYENFSNISCQTNHHLKNKKKKTTSNCSSFWLVYANLSKASSISTDNQTNDGLSELTQPSELKPPERCIWGHSSLSISPATSTHSVLLFRIINIVLQWRIWAI